MSDPTQSTETPSDSAQTESPTMTSVEQMFEEIEVDEPVVGIIMGSKNDKPKMGACMKRLAGLRVGTDA